MSERRRFTPPAGQLHRFVDANGVTWTFTLRGQVRESEEGTHVTILIESPWEARVASCPRAEWEVETPDYLRILAGSVPTGGSRGRVPPNSPPATRDEPGF